MKNFSWQLWRWPVLLGVISLIGLVSALLGDGYWDIISWLTLGLPIVSVIIFLCPLRIAMTSPVTSATALIISRIAASLLGGWVFVWGFSTLTITSLVALGQPYDEAYTANTLLVFLVFLGIFLWSFTAASLIRIWLVLVGGGVMMTAIAWALQRSLV